MPNPETITVEPVGRFDVTIDDLPGSRSLTNRALLLGALAEGSTRVENALWADDTRIMIDALRALRFVVRENRDTREFEVEGRGGAIPASSANLNLGDAGTAMRMLTAAVCLGRGEYSLDGSARMRQRPIDGLVAPLNRIGADIRYTSQRGHPPLTVGARGLVGGAVTLDKPVSSQFISALLIAAPGMSHGLELTCKGHTPSPPYIHMTAKVMESFGVHVHTQHDGAWMSVAPGGYTGCVYAVEPDASSAGYLLAAAAITPGARCTVHGLGTHSLQGDVWFVKVLEKMGAGVVMTDGAITVEGRDRLCGLDVDLCDMPDAAQTLAVVALFAQGPTVIRNVGNLRFKETDRLAALKAELEKLGARVTIAGHDIKVEPEKPGVLRPATIETYGDHRMAMSFALAGLRSSGIAIHDPGCVGKTFPDFWRYLDRLRDSSR